jgi:ATP sulfurylase
MNELGIKIICTLGPSSFDNHVLTQLDGLGVGMFRLNLSHTLIDELEQRIQFIINTTSVPLCIDTEGAQIRTGRLANGVIELRHGDSVNLIPEDIEGDATTFTLTPPEVFDALQAGTMLSVDFNAALLLVVECGADSARAQVLSGGRVGSNKGVTADQNIALPPISQKDRQAIDIALRHDINQFALSFAHNQSSVLAIKELVGQGATVISKVESQAALRGIDGIINVSDAILIDRGDLSREIPVEHLPFLQKRVINKAHQYPIPVYVATNLLESMVYSPYPSRAEVSDIISTLQDGANGLVLAAETAIGRYPGRCVAMVKRLVNQYLSESWPGVDFGFEWRGNGMFQSAVAAHGGKLTRKRPSAGRTTQDIYACPRIVVDPATVRDIEQIDSGVYSPLNGFMGRDEVNSVLERYSLNDGNIWTLPIVLQTESRTLPSSVGDDLALVCSCCDEAVALIKVNDVYSFDLDNICLRWFGSTDKKHPGVARLAGNGDCFVGGEITLLKQHTYAQQQHCLSPPQVRATFAHNGWERVVGFHTRNTPHMAHEHIQMAAVERVGADGLFINPALGQKKSGDFSQEAILAGYEAMIGACYPPERVLLSGFFGNSWYSGPREAVFTAICRKNFGCSHFIVGRDHTGVGSFYKPTDVEALFEKLGDVGIEPVFFDEVVFDPREDQYREVRLGEDTGLVNRISGTMIRQYLHEGKAPPEWMMRPEVSEALLGIARCGGKVFDT